MRSKKCKFCKKQFTPERQMQSTCSFECAIEHSKVLKEAKIKKKKSDFRKNDKSVQKELAQKVFNTYIRARDKDLPCISCGEHTNRQMHAGHYFSQGGHTYLRFNTLNVHKQCSICNNWKSGNLAEYKENLIKKIGLGKYNWLDAHKHDSTKHHDLEYYQRIIKIFRKKLKRIY